MGSAGSGSFPRELAAGQTGRHTRVDDTGVEKPALGSQAQERSPWPRGVSVWGGRTSAPQVPVTRPLHPHTEPSQFQEARHPAVSHRAVWLAGKGLHPNLRAQERAASLPQDDGAGGAGPEAQGGCCSGRRARSRRRAPGGGRRGGRPGLQRGGRPAPVRAPAPRGLRPNPELPACGVHDCRPGLTGPRRPVSGPGTACTGSTRSASPSSSELPVPLGPVAELGPVSPWQVIDAHQKCNCPCRNAQVPLVRPVLVVKSSISVNYYL